MGFRVRSAAVVVVAAFVVVGFVVTPAATRSPGSDAAVRVTVTQAFNRVQANLAHLAVCRCRSAFVTLGFTATDYMGKLAVESAPTTSVDLGRMHAFYALQDFGRFAVFAGHAVDAGAKQRADLEKAAAAMTDARAAAARAVQLLEIKTKLQLPK